MKLFDLHCDTATECEKQGLSMHSNPLHWDFSRITAIAESSYQVTAVYVPDETDNKDAWSYTSRVFSFIQTQNLPIVRTTADLKTFPHGILLAIENGKSIGYDVAKLDELALMGIVYITLTWNGCNLIGNGALSREKTGLTPFGKSVVLRMNELGILPDVSHLNVKGFWDVAELNNGHPILASHSDSFSVNPHPRNITDDQFKAILNSGGLVGLNFCDAHLGKHSFETIEAHLDQYLSLGGENTVALGMDLDGTPLPESWGGVEVSLRLYEHFLKKGYTQTLVDKLFFENSYSFFMKTLTRREKCIRIGS